MVVHVEPLAVAAVPDARLLGLRGAGPALPVDVLRQADVGDAGGVLPDDVHVRVQDGRVDWLAVLRQYCPDMQNHQGHFTAKEEQRPTFSNLFYTLLTFHWILEYHKN